MRIELKGDHNFAKCAICGERAIAAWYGETELYICNLIFEIFA